MNDYAAPFEGELAPVIINRLVSKGKEILELCLERGRNLSMKGFIDCQIEQGGIYLQVVEGIKEHVELRLGAAPRTSERALLRDLLDYAEAQLQGARAAIAEPMEV